MIVFLVCVGIIGVCLIIQTVCIIRLFSLFRRSMIQIRTELARISTLNN